MVARDYVWPEYEAIVLVPYIFFMARDCVWPEMFYGQSMVARDSVWPEYGGLK